MPYMTLRPWHGHFYHHPPCPSDVSIPLHDPEAYGLNPRHAWVYNKLEIALKQGLIAAPHGVTPTEFPVFSKPIYNLFSMGKNSAQLNCIEDYNQQARPGHMWCELLTGEHISTDIAVIDGHAAWICHTKGYPLEKGTFDRWEILAGNGGNTSLSAALIDFIQSHLADYTGMLNIESLGGKIIEVHLRFTSQWAELYGEGFSTSLISLYKDKRWTLGEQVTNAYSIVLFSSRKADKKPPEDLIQTLIDGDKVVNIHLPFYEDKPTDKHSMPPGGFRLAYINGYDLEACLQAREHLRTFFNSQ